MTARAALKERLIRAGRRGNRILGRVGLRLYPLRFLPLGVDPAVDIGKLRRGEEVRVVFDVGANVGRTMRVFARDFPRARICCFEPVPSTFARLQRNAAPFKNVSVFKHGFGEQPGEFEIYLNESNPGQNSLVRSSSAAHTETVSVQTLDAFCEAQGVSRIDFLKIDTEGFELQVLKGAGRMLAEGRIDLIFAEVCFSPDDTAHTFFPTLNEFLRTRSFGLFAFYDPRHWRNPRTCDHADVLFVNLAMKPGPLPQQDIP